MFVYHTSTLQLGVELRARASADDAEVVVDPQEDGDDEDRGVGAETDLELGLVEVGEVEGAGVLLAAAVDAERDSVDLVARDVEVDIRKVAGAEEGGVLLDAVGGVADHKLGRHDGVDLVAVGEADVVLGLDVLLGLDDESEEEGGVVEGEVDVDGCKGGLVLGSLELVALDLAHEVEEAAGLHLLALISFEEDVIELEPDRDGGVGEGAAVLVVDHGLRDLTGRRGDPEGLDRGKVDRDRDLVRDGGLREGGARELEAVKVEVEVVRLLGDLGVGDELGLGVADAGQLVRDLCGVLEEGVVDEAGEAPLLGDGDTDDLDGGVLDVAVHESVDVVGVVIRGRGDETREERADGGLLDEIGGTRDLDLDLARGAGVERDRHGGLSEGVDGNETALEEGLFGVAVQRLVLVSEGVKLAEGTLGG